MGNFSSDLIEGDAFSNVPVGIWGCQLLSGENKVAHWVILVIRATLVVALVHGQAQGQPLPKIIILRSIVILFLSRRYFCSC